MIAALLCFAAALALWRLHRRIDNGACVSSAWLDSQCVTEGRSGWEGPRWRFPAERDAMRRDRVARIAAVRSGQKRRVS